MTNRIHYIGSGWHCELTAHSCKKLGVPAGSIFSKLDPDLAIYTPTKIIEGDNTGINVRRYELVRVNNSDEE